MKCHVRAVVLLFIVAAVSGLAGLLVIGCGGDGDGPVTPTNPPTIRMFSLAPTDMAPGDSTRMTYAVTGADSVILLPDNLLLLPADTGQQWLKPTTPQSYTLRAYNIHGQDSASASLTMNAASPQIDVFVAVEDTLLVGDSTLLYWKARRSDSIAIQGLGSFTTTDSSGVVVAPSTTTFYRAIAYNSVARDTADELITVEVPAALVSINTTVYGDYYRGAMGGGLINPLPQFRVENATGNPLTRPWIHFSVLEGDGTLSADSLQPITNGIATLGYQFDGSSGRARIRALVRGIDTLDVSIRADTIIAGDGGQGQYVLFDDTYAQVLAYYGQPAAIDLDPNSLDFFYLDYENTLELVFMLWDNDNGGFANTTDEVKGVIVTEGWTGGKLQGQVGIGSTITEVRALYGTEDAIVHDTTAPPADSYVYDTLGLEFWVFEGDSVVFEFHVSELDDPFFKIDARERRATPRRWRGGR